MIFNAETKEKFIKDISFYENQECFCLGKTFSEAGKIVYLINQNKDRKEINDVGMDNART